MAKIKIDFLIMMMYYTLLTFENSVVVTTIRPHDSAVYHMIYHEVKPYIFENELGEVTGIVPDIYKTFESLCLSEIGTTSVIKYVKKVSSQKQLMDMYYNESMRYGEGELENVTMNTALWGPIITAEKVEYNATRGVVHFPTCATENMAVIVKRSRIRLMIKLVVALKTGIGIFCITSIFVIISGLIFWLLERADNPLISRPSFAQSLVNSLWWSVITMATVGYGDFVPHTRIGRIWSVFWMYLALVATCIITAAITSAVYGVENFALDGKRVSVIANSYEGMTAAETYSTKNIEYESFEEALDAVANEDVFAALINEQVVAWNMDMLSGYSAETLVVINVLPVNIGISGLYSVSETAARFWKCSQRFSNLFQSTSVKYIKKIPVDVVHFIAFEKIFKFRNPSSFLVLFGVICLFFIGGVVYDVVNKHIAIKGFDVSKGGRSSRHDASSRVRHELQQLRAAISNEIKVTNFGT